jgi:HEAT repeat protein
MPLPDGGSGGAFGWIAACRALHRSAVIVAAACGFATAQDADDVAKLAAQLGSSDREARREAAYQLQRKGPAAKAALPELIRALDDSDKQVWTNALGAIAAIGPDARDAVPRLMQAMDGRKPRDSRTRDRGQMLMRSAHALACIGDAAKPALIDALKQDDAGLRIGAAKALGEMGPPAKDALPALMENLSHRDDEVFNEVIDAIGQIGKDAAGPLIQSLGAPDARARLGSVRALAAIGSAANAGRALLDRNAKEPETQVRAAILRALPGAGLGQDKFVPVLVSALRGADAELRSAATHALLVVRPAEKVAVPAVAALLADPDAAVAERGVHVLGRYGIAARSAVPALVARAARGGRPSSVDVEALTEIGGPAVPELLKLVANIPPASLNRDHWALKILAAIGPAGLPELTSALESKNPSIRVAALGTLNELGEAARDARAAIVKLSADDEPVVRATVLSALVSMKSDEGGLVERIEVAARDKAPVVRLAAATAAGALGPEASALAGPVGVLIDDSDSRVSAAAIRAIGAMGGASPAVVARLSSRLKDPALKDAVLEALGRLGPEAAAAAPELIALYPKADRAGRSAILAAVATSSAPAAVELVETALKDPDPAIRAAALRAFSHSQPDIRLVVERLTAALQDPDRVVRLVAMENLARLGDKDPQKVASAAGPLIALLVQSEDRPPALDTLRAMRVRDLDALAQGLASPVVEARVWACERIARLGKDARPLEEKLKPLLADGNDYVRRAARKAVEQLHR